jgi:hypothetical protein
MENVIVPFPVKTVEIRNQNETLTDFISIGVFNAALLRAQATIDDVFDDLRNLRQEGDDVIDVGSGWGVVLDHQTVAVRTLLRIAAVTDDRVIPYSDIAQAIVKMAEWGPEVSDQTIRTEFGKRWGACLEAYPSSAAVAKIADFVGARLTPKGVDFSTTRYVIEPSDTELAVLEALEMQYDQCAPTSRLCRLLPGSPSRTKADYSILKAIPFVLKQDREVNRLIGCEPNPLLRSSDDKSSYVSMSRSNDGSRVLLQFIVSEQNVEGNSFNIPPSAREAIHGIYRNLRSKGSIRYNIDGKDARKVTGVGKYIRTVYPNYVDGQVCFIKLDRAEFTADVILCGEDDIAAELELKRWVEEIDAQAA